MKKITGDVQALIMDVMLAHVGVVMRMAMQEFGDVPQKTAEEIAGALGREMALIQTKAEGGFYS